MRGREGKSLDSEILRTTYGPYEGISCHRLEDYILSTRTSSETSIMIYTPKLQFSELMPNLGARANKKSIRPVYMVLGCNNFIGRQTSLEQLAHN